TKCGHGPEWKLPEQNFAAGVQKELATSLDTLKTDVIDLYILHRDNQEMPVGTILEALQPAIESGQVLALGASNWEYRRVVEANEYAEQHGLTGFAVVSNTLSLAQPAAAFYTGLVHADPIGERWHQETGIPLLPW
ncbi:MAG TPA: aldo/keto reductase, partial [Candidatus Latescibacteria bacterium]|nr:aldo/keto reductase [Candidatus Latescibacterota bacterium]